MHAAATMDDYMPRLIWVLLSVGSILTIYLAGRIAERRGRSFKTWAWIAGLLLGPLALPLLWLLPNLRRNDPGGPTGEKRPAEMSGAIKPVIPGDRGPGHLGMSVA
jgi:hypothetical protein